MNKTNVRYLSIGALALTLLLPLALITELAYERESYFAQAQTTVFEGWGHAQAVTAPVLRVPVRQSQEIWRVGKAASHQTFAASHAEHRVAIEHFERKRGIFAVPVYTATLSINAEFTPDSGDRALDWQNAELVLELTDSFGLQEASLLINDQPQAFTRTATTDSLVAAVDASTPLTVEVRLELRGAESFRLTPAALRANTEITGSWPHPSFQGRFLPEDGDVADTGFTAAWRYGQVTGLPESWHGEVLPQSFTERDSVVELNQPVSVYRMAQRSAKYGILFCAVTYLTLLCFEFSSGWRFHVIQYATVGAAMLIFFLVLLALAEHIPFVLAYFSAASVIGGLVSWYVQGITHRSRLTWTVSGVLIGAYAALFILLRLEAYALLAGTVVVLIGLGALMWSTQKLAAPPPETGVE